MEYYRRRYSSAAGAVIVITTSISAPNLNSRKKIPTSTAVAEFARCRE
jgi:hypothetical protein